MPLRCPKCKKCHTARYDCYTVTVAAPTRARGETLVSATGSEESRWKITIYPKVIEPYDCVATGVEKVKQLVAIALRFEPAAKIVIEEDSPQNVELSHEKGSWKVVSLDWRLSLRSKTRR